jgi:TatD DNase family protein
MNARSDNAGEPELVDIGINLTHDSYDHDREAVLHRALRVGVSRMVVTGASLESNPKASALAANCPLMLRATAGCHPHHAAELLAPGALARLAEHATAPHVTAVGECGLDYYRDFSPRAAQREAFEAQLELAARLGKPVFLHCRDAHADFAAILRPWRSRLVDAIAHCFTGTRAELVECLDLGLAIGITGWICDERRGHHLLDLVPLVPRGRLMIETDGPYLLPRDLVPKPVSRRNEPMYLPHIAATVARARRETVAELAAHTTAAARAFFALP